MLLGSPGARQPRGAASGATGRSAGQSWARPRRKLLLAPRARRWSGARDLGIIAGDMPFGLGRLVGEIDAPNDGTVWVEETRLAGAKEHLTLRVSHSGMVLSAAVARQDRRVLAGGQLRVTRRRT